MAEMILHLPSYVHAIAVALACGAGGTLMGLLLGKWDMRKLDK